MSDFEGIPDEFDPRDWEAANVDDQGVRQSPDSGLHHGTQMSGTTPEYPIDDNGLHPGIVPETPGSQPGDTPGYAKNQLFETLTSEADNPAQQQLEELDHSHVAIRWLGSRHVPPQLTSFFEPSMYKPEPEEPLSDAGARELLFRQLVGRTGIMTTYSQIREGIHASGVLSDRLAQDVGRGITHSAQVIPERLRNGLRAGQYLIQTDSTGRVTLQTDETLHDIFHRTYERYDTPGGHTYLIANDNRSRIRIINPASDTEEAVVMFDEPHMILPDSPAYFAGLKTLLENHESLLDQLGEVAGIDPSIFKATENVTNEALVAFKRLDSIAVKEHIAQHGIPDVLSDSLLACIQSLYEAIRYRPVYDPGTDSTTDLGLRGRALNTRSYYRVV